MATKTRRARVRESARTQPPFIVPEPSPSIEGKSGGRAYRTEKSRQAPYFQKKQELTRRGILDRAGRPVPLEERPEYGKSFADRVESRMEAPPATAEAPAGAPAAAAAPAAPSKVYGEELAGPPLSASTEYAPKAEAPDPAEMQKLFRTVMGTSFDPNSRMDRSKMQAMQDFYTTSGGMGGRTPTRFALDYYKTLK
jgi:hypothetical protein